MRTQRSAVRAPELVVTLDADLPAGLDSDEALHRQRAPRELDEYDAPGDYVAAVVRGEVRDPTLSFQLRRGFRVIGLADGYLVNDPESQGHAALIEWLNPDLAKPSDYASQPQGDHAVRARQR